MNLERAVYVWKSRHGHLQPSANWVGTGCLLGSRASAVRSQAGNMNGLVHCSLLCVCAAGVPPVLTVAVLPPGVHRLDRPPPERVRVVHRHPVWSTPLVMHRAHAAAVHA